MGRIATVSAFCFVIMMLAACSTTGTVPIPDTLLTCKEEPQFQNQKVSITVGDVIEFTDEVALAGADCRTKLKAVRKIEQARKSKSPSN